MVCTVVQYVELNPVLACLTEAPCGDTVIVSPSPQNTTLDSEMTLDLCPVEMILDKCLSHAAHVCEEIGQTVL